jgi:hypothetical protein
LIFGDDVAVADSEHGGPCEVETVNVFGVGVGLRLANAPKPVILLVKQGDGIDD